MAVNKYGNNKPVVKEKKVKTEVMFQVDSMEDISRQVQGKEILRILLNSRDFSREMKAINNY